MPTWATEVTLRVRRYFRRRATNGDGAAAVVREKLVRWQRKPESMSTFHDPRVSDNYSSYALSCEAYTASDKSFHMFHDFHRKFQGGNIQSAGDTYFAGEFQVLRILEGKHEKISRICLPNAEKLKYWQARGQ